MGRVIRGGPRNSDESYPSLGRHWCSLSYRSLLILSYRRVASEVAEFGPLEERGRGEPSEPAGLRQAWVRRLETPVQHGVGWSLPRYFVPSPGLGVGLLGEADGTGFCMVCAGVVLGGLFGEGAPFSTMSLAG